MPYNSNLLTIEENDSSFLGENFVRETVFSTSIRDRNNMFQKDYERMNRICSSIPSPFSRLYMLNMAFREVTSYEEMIDSKGYSQRGCTLHERSLYHFLVDDCLDMLEFIFYYGSRPEFNVVAWNIENETTKLINSPHGGIQDLGRSLKKHLMEDNTLHNLRDIYLFTWNLEPENPNSIPLVIGGTSPFTLVFTSPNWVRQLREYGLSFPAGNTGRMLFESNPTLNEQTTPLMNRSTEFKAYMYRLYFAYSTLCPSLREFWKYIKQSWEYYNQENDEDMKAIGVPGNALNYSPIIFKEEYYTQLHFSTFDANGRVAGPQLDPDVMGVKIRCRQ